MHSQIFKFLISGAVAASINITILFIFTEVFGLWYLLSSVLVFIISMAIGFSLQKWWTFNSNSNQLIKKQFSLYLGLGAANLLLNTALMYTFTDILGFWYIISQILSAGLLAVMNFTIYRAYIFTHQEEK